jgi:DNA-directed RNA polymerase specialized sigma24 family protein
MSTEASRLSRIETLWSVVRRAHDGSDGTVRAAQQSLLDRYGGAVRRYLRASLRDDDAADEVFQEFALRFVRGDFRAAHPERGRFRSFVKTTLYHLIVDYHRSAGRRPGPLPAVAVRSRAASGDADDERFHQAWRQELLDRSWAALAALEREQGTPFHSALRMLVDDPRRRSREIAAQLSQRSNKPISAGNLRVVIHRARRLFAEQLVREVSDSLETRSLDETERELIDLNLLDYCRSTLDRMRESQPAIAETLEAS